MMIDAGRMTATACADTGASEPDEKCGSRHKSILSIPFERWAEVDSEETHKSANPKHLIGAHS